MVGRLDGKVAMITGAASGIGLGTVELFVAEGAQVVAADIQDEKGAMLEKRFPGKVVYAHCDVTKEADIEAAVKKAKTEFGGLDILFNNAGIGRGGPYEDMPWEDAMAVININLVAVLSGIHLAIPLLKATPGSLCFSTSSSSAIFGMAGIAVYSATKHAVKGFTEALSVELKPFGVRVADTL
ncbi:SDR family NAD(P)-dependent oxidoreductase, partial [Phenylobacterium sp.]|uniref:SDR family NAD(P)-dependent oxidoreductase n=1 Tax=Phenylobacterium sp. TaxID=1871053 RepID=UPI002735A899